MNVVTLNQAATLLAKGQVGVIPTDTVYGLVASANNEFAVTRLYQLKDRVRKPGSLIAHDTDQLVHLGFDRQTVAALDQYFKPGTSVVVEHPIDYLHQGLGDQAVRIVTTGDIGLLLEQTGPLQTSSANKPGEPLAEAIEDAYHYFGDTVDFYVDGGNLQGRKASNIIKVQPDGTAKTLR